MIYVVINGEDNSVYHVYKSIRKLSLNVAKEELSLIGPYDDEEDDRRVATASEIEKAVRENWTADLYPMEGENWTLRIEKVKKFS